MDKLRLMYGARKRCLRRIQQMLVQVKFSGFSLQHCKLLEQQGRSWNVPIDKLIRNLETWCVVLSDCKILINVKIIVIINEKEIHLLSSAGTICHELTDREKSFLKIKYKMTAFTISTDHQPPTIAMQIGNTLQSDQVQRARTSGPTPRPPSAPRPPSRLGIISKPKKYKDKS